MISVIVPIYNSCDTLTRCIESLICQSWHDFELILVDDGSTDNSQEICLSYSAKDDRIKFFKKENGGASSARNVGIENSLGEFITFCDSDDYVGEDWLLSFMEQANGTELVCQGYVGVSKDNNQTFFSFDTSEIKSVEVGLDYLFNKSQLGYTPMKLFKSDIIKNNNISFNTDFWLKEDELFVLTYLKYVSTIAFSKQCQYYYVDSSFCNKYASEGNKVFSLLMEEYRTIIDYPFIDRNSSTLLAIRARLTNTLLNSFDSCNVGYQRMREYKQLVGAGFYQVTGVSFFLKFAYMLPIPFGHLLFSLKKFI